MAEFIGSEPLPAHFAAFKKSESKKYRDAVCEFLHLRYLKIGGNGDCFFEAVSALLLLLRGVTLDACDLRHCVCSFLLDCSYTDHGILGERCVIDMQGELDKRLVSSIVVRRDPALLTPSTILDYITASSRSGVWVEGYHWLRAVAKLQCVCVCVVIHTHDHVLLFGDVTHDRIYLYKRDAETHYDALPSVEVMYDPLPLHTTSPARPLQFALSRAMYTAPPDPLRPRPVLPPNRARPLPDAIGQQRQRLTKLVDALLARCRSKGLAVGKQFVQRVLRKFFSCTALSLMDIDEAEEEGITNQASEVLECQLLNRIGIVDMQQQCMEDAIIADDADAVDAAFARIQALQCPEFSTSESALDSFIVITSSSSDEGVGPDPTELPGKVPVKAQLLPAPPRRSLRSCKKTKTSSSSDSSSNSSSSSSSSRANTRKRFLAWKAERKAGKEPAFAGGKNAAMYTAVS